MTKLPSTTRSNRRSVLGLVLLPLLLPISALAKVIQEFSPKYNIGDGKNGRVYKVWTQALKERNVHKVTAKLYRKSGGDDCYVNLRFGKDGKTFEGGRRVYLRTDKSVSVTWKVEGKPNGQPLVMNAYNGEVYVRHVQTHDE